MNHAYNHARLMVESQSRLELAACYDTPVDNLITTRLLEQPDAYRRWEGEHARLMRAVSEQAKLTRQIVALRSTAFALVHRRALFDYLREHHLSAPRRRRLFTLFYGFRDYTNAVLAEHGNYVRCSSSYLCAQHLAEHLMRDAAFQEPLQIYEQWYAEYFKAYCDVELAETEDEKHAVAAMASLKPLLKHQLAEARKVILDMPQMPVDEWREVQIRRATGDTQRVRTLFMPRTQVN